MISKWDCLNWGGRWIEFSEELSRRSGIKVEFEPVKSFQEESIKLRDRYFQLYYAGPMQQIELLNSGYRPVAKFKGQKDSLFIITKKGLPEKGIIRIALPILKFAQYGLMEFDISRVKLTFTRNFYEVYKLVKEEKVDAGIMYSESWNQIDDKDDINILKNIGFETQHIFMVYKPLYEKIKPALLSFQELEEATEDDIKKSKQMMKDFDMLSRRWEMENIANFLINSDYIGVLIRKKDKILFVNNYISKLTSFDKDELLKMSYLDFKSRIKGGVRNGSDIQFTTKDNRKIYIDVYISKIFYIGEPAEMIVIIDDTRRKRAEKLKQLLTQINQAIIYSLTEEELFEKISIALTEKVGLKLVWIGKEENNQIKPVYVKGDASSYIEGMTIPLDPATPESKGPTATAYREDKITINHDTMTDYSIKPWREKLIKFNLLFSASIPIKSDGKPKYTINMYSDERDFFNEDFLKILQELKTDLEYGLEKIDQIRKSTIISTALRNSKSWILVTDENGIITYVNSFIAELTGYTAEELIGKHTRIFKSGYHDKYFYKKLWDTILSGKEFNATFVNKKKNGEIFYIDQTIYPLILPGNIRRFVSVGKDITKDILTASEISKLKFHDPVTELYNLYGFSFKAQEELKISSISCLILLDILNFTLINKEYGFEVGNSVLKYVARRIKSIVREKDLVARTFSDEFAILITNLRRREDIITIVQKFIEAFKEDFIEGNTNIPISVSIGVAVYPDDDKMFDKLYEKASLALKEAKSKGKTDIVFYNKELEEKGSSLIFAEYLISKAIKENLFVFYYQPYFKTEDIKLAGFEALVRIVDKDGKVYSPNSFISALENSKFLRDFEMLGLEKVKEKSKKWGKFISFNISANSLKENKFLDILENVEDEYNIVYEITERELINEFEKIKYFINKTKSKRNIKVAIDDFGTGYSSLNYLKELDADILKIDISFIRNITTSKKDFLIVKSIVEFAKNLGMEPLAEGVETKQQYEALKSIGCTYVQGYLFGKPMPEEEVERLFGF